MERDRRKKVIAALAAGLLLLTGCTGGKDSAKKAHNSYPGVLYLKDGEMEYIDLKGDRKPVELTEELLQGVNRYPDPIVSILTTVSADGKKFLYVDETGGETWGADLFYREITKEGLSKPLAIDVKVTDYKVDDDLRSLIYVTENGNLYHFDLEKGEREKLDKGVVGYMFASSDAKKILYDRPGKGVYELQLGGEKKKVADSMFVAYANADLSLIYYYTEDGILYKKSFGKEAEQIDENVHVILDIYPSGEIYYTKKSDEKIDWSRFIDDDMEESDKKLEYVASPFYPARESYPSDEAYDKAYAEYEEQLEKYNAFSAMTIRSELRHKIENDEMEYQSSDLYYYDAKESRKIAGGTIPASFGSGMDRSVGHQESRDFVDRKAIAGFLSYEGYDGKPKPLSQIMEKAGLFYDLESMLDEVLLHYSGYYLTMYGEVGEKFADYKPDKMTDVYGLFDVTLDGRSCYYIDDRKPDGTADLYKIDLSSGKASEPTLYRKGLIAHAIWIAGDGTLLYIDDADESKHSLVLNEKDRLKGGYMPYPNDLHHETGRMLLYAQPGGEETSTTELWTYDLEKLEKISDNVEEAILLDSGDIVYLQDHDPDVGGDLYLYVPDGEDIKLAEEVQSIIDPRMTWEDMAG